LQDVHKSCNSLTVGHFLSKCSIIRCISARQLSALLSVELRCGAASDVRHVCYALCNLTYTNSRTKHLCPSTEERKDVRYKFCPKEANNSRTYTNAYSHNIGCGRNSELIINKNNILVKVIGTSFITSQFTLVLNFFYIVSLSVYVCLLGSHRTPQCTGTHQLRSCA
jgi:hypothetical protein